MTPVAGVGPRQALLLRLLDHVTGPLLAVDANGVVVTANAAAATLCGRSRSLLRGKPFPVLIALDDRRAFRHALHELEEADAVDVEARLIRDPDQPHVLRLRRLAERPLLASLRIEDSDGRPPTSPEPVTTTRDLVALEVEAMLLRLPQAVLGVNADGTLRFANARARGLFGGTQLRRRRPIPERLGELPLGPLVERLVHRAGPLPPELLELPDGRALRVTGSGAHGDAPAVLVFDDITAHVGRSRVEREFVRNAAHQLRTPVAGIANAVEVLQSGAKENPEERDRFLDHIERETTRLAQLTRALLVLARAQSGTQPPRLEFVPLEPMLREISARTVTAADVELRVECAPRLAALAERDLLGEALAALTENAARHTTQGTITLRAEPRDARLLEIIVADSGTGILPELQEQLFEPFTRGSADNGGFGVGLSIAQQAVAAMGSRLRVDSEPQQGSRFSFRLPSAEVV